MKIGINKKISQVHWSAFIAAGLCFFTAGQLYKEYKEVKCLIEECVSTTGIVIKKLGDCAGHSRGGNHVKVTIPAIHSEQLLKIDYQTCLTTNPGDTIPILYSDDFDRIIKYDPLVIKAGNGELYIAVSAAMLGISFLLFGNKKTVT